MFLHLFPIGIFLNPASQPAKDEGADEFLSIFIPAHDRLRVQRGDDALDFLSEGYRHKFLCDGTAALYIGSLCAPFKREESRYKGTR